MAISTSTVLVTSPDLTVADLGDEAVVLDPSTGKYFGLNAVGTRILSLAASPTHLDDLIEQLHAEYEVPRAVLTRDVTAFVEDLTRRGILVTR